MRNVKIFAGSSHPLLTEAICERLGTTAAKCELSKFSNGETSVNISTSVREQDIFIVQSGSETVNDAVLELLVMVSACKGGSAKSITAVMPYFPYSRQSKKKSHRGAITARLVANLLSVAGIDHVITVDLHAPPTQGFFGKPVDNLHAEPLIARWIRNNVAGWKEAVVVSKNAGGTKRVTSLADALKLNFGLVTTDRRRTPIVTSLEGSGILERFYHQREDQPNAIEEPAPALQNGQIEDSRIPHRYSPRSIPQVNGFSPPFNPHRSLTNPITSSPLTQSTRVDSASPPTTRRLIRHELPTSAPSRTLELDANQDEEENEEIEEYNDERARDVITGRLIHGHIVDDSVPSPALSAMSGGGGGDSLGSPMFEEKDPMAMSFMSGLSRHGTDRNGLAASIHPTEHSDDEEEEFKDPELEHTVTLVGNVRDRTVFIIDDLIDQAGSWIAAAETVVKRGDAKKVYCIATHGLFGDDSLEQMEDCECIDHIVVTNTYPLGAARVRASKKLVILDISHLLSEAIRRNHYGESISSLFQALPD